MCNDLVAANVIYQMNCLSRFGQGLHKSSRVLVRILLLENTDELRMPPALVIGVYSTGIDVPSIETAFDNLDLLTQ